MPFLLHHIRGRGILKRREIKEELIILFVVSCVLFLLALPLDILSACPFLQHLSVDFPPSQV